MPYKHNKQLVPLAKHLRKEMTKEERHLWYDFLRDYPVRFLRQKVIGHYVADFYCAKAKLVIELDGAQHYTDENLQKDVERSLFLASHDIKVLRILNKELNEDFDSVCLYIDAIVRQLLSLDSAALLLQDDESPFHLE